MLDRAREELTEGVPTPRRHIYFYLLLGLSTLALHSYVQSSANEPHLNTPAEREVARLQELVKASASTALNQ